MRSGCTSQELGGWFWAMWNTPWRQKENGAALRKECFPKGRLHVPKGNKAGNPEKHSNPSENGPEATKNVK